MEKQRPGRLPLLYYRQLDIIEDAAVSEQERVGFRKTCALCSAFIFSRVRRSVLGSAGVSHTFPRESNGMSTYLYRVHYLYL